jgi:small subunit ribosomal protein S8
MSMTDPIADLLTRIRNANGARKEQVDVPWSRHKEAIVRVVVDEGFLSSYSVVEDGVKRTLRVVLRYDGNHRPVIQMVKRVSRPSLRVYVGATEIPPIRGGLGIHILSTPAGVLVDREARKRKVGGEVLCSIW